MWRKKFFTQHDKRKRINKFRSANKALQKKKALKSDGATLEVYSWNVEETGSPVEIDSLVTGSTKDQPEVVCLQRANLPPPDTETNHYKWHCGSSTSGSAILIKKSSDLVLNSFEQFSDQICMADFTGKQGVRINVISCYIPPATDYACTDLWTKLKEVIGSISPTAIFILAGDFNAQVGKDNVQFSSMSASELTLKRLYHKTSNENGKRLTDLIRKCHLRLFISQKKNSSDVFTFNDGKTKTQESFIILPFPRPSFSGEGYNFWQQKYNHAMIRFKLLYKPFDPVPVEKNEEGSVEVRPPVIASWNIQNATPAKVDKMLNEYNVPVVCIQELFLTSDEDIQTENYNWLSPKKLWAKNVGILVKKCPNISVSSFEPLSEFICAATVMFYDKPLIVISSHLPPESDPQHSTVLTQMRELIKGIPEDVFVILGGDFSSVMKTEKDVPNADLFIQDLASEIKMELAGGSAMYKRFCHLTQISEEGKCRAHYVLVSQSSLKTIFPKLWCRWTPFFENLLVSIVAVTDIRPKKFTFDKLKAIDHPVVEVFDDKNEDGITKKTVIYKLMSESGNEVRDDITSLVSPDDVEKFKDTPAPAEDLGRILKDFVLLKVANRKSFVVLTPFITLIKSLCECKLGPLTVEEVKEANGRKICRLKWQDILLAEEDGSAEEQSINLRNKAASAVFTKICQTCYTVKAKNSFFNKGKQPLLMNSPELAEVMKIVKKESFPTLEDVYKHIDEFITKDSDEELVFGADFPKQEILDIAGYAYANNELDIRFFMSKKRIFPPPDTLAVFRKRSPQYLRDMLIKKPKNLKYYLVHPCGLGGDYEEFSKRFSADILKEESELFSKTNTAQQNTQHVKQVQKPKGGERPSGASPRVSQNTRPQVSGGERPSGGSPRVIQNTRPQVSGSRKRDFNSSNSNENGFKRSGPSGGARSVSKRQKFDTPVDNRSFKPEMPHWPKIRPLVIVWPVTVRSQLEERPEHVLSENFTVEFQTKDVNGQNVTAVSVALTHYNGLGKMYCIARGSSARNAARVALDLLIKHCTVIKPNANYLCNGRVPNFIRYKVPCQFNPRTYLILDRHETGQLSWKVIEDLVERFLNSNEEEMFFDRDSYSFTEKLALVESVPKLAPSKLLVRHFGDDNKLVDRYVCVYKVKPKQDILREVLKMRGQHPKYTMTTNRLPPGIEYNIF